MKKISFTVMYKSHFGLWISTSRNWKHNSERRGEWMCEVRIMVHNMENRRSDNKKVDETFDGGKCWEWDLIWEGLSIEALI